MDEKLKRGDPIIVRDLRDFDQIADDETYISVGDGLGGSFFSITKGEYAGFREEFFTRLKQRNAENMEIIEKFIIRAIYEFCATQDGASTILQGQLHAQADFVHGSYSTSEYMKRLIPQNGESSGFGLNILQSLAYISHGRELQASI